MLGSGAILVVEDEFIVRLETVVLLSLAGYVVLEASHADEAIAVLERHGDIRLVLTDIEMPGTMDGLELAQHICERWPLVLIVVVSGKASIEVGQMPRGARFLRKPYGDKTIVATVASMLSAID